MYIETDVPESYITNVTKGKNVKVEFPVLGKTIETKVRQAGDVINPANRTFKVEVAVPNKDKTIKPNLTASLKLTITLTRSDFNSTKYYFRKCRRGTICLCVTDKNDNDEGMLNALLLKPEKHKVMLLKF